jgi:hypothetical protein
MKKQETNKTLSINTKNTDCFSQHAALNVIFLFSDFSPVISIIESPLPFAKWEMPACRQVHSKVIASKTPVPFFRDDSHQRQKHQA